MKLHLQPLEGGGGCIRYLVSYAMLCWTDGLADIKIRIISGMHMLKAKSTQNNLKFKMINISWFSIVPYLYVEKYKN